MNRKFHIKKGDLVQVNAGEDKGKQGKVLEVFPDKERAIVEGINMISKHTKPNAKYPQGGTWVGIKPDLSKIADEKGIFFVCPDGKNTWYWDSPLNADVRYETFISDELVKYVDSHYKTVADRKGRAITGLSMGGHGAMWNGLRHSDVFSAAGSTSGGVDIRPFPKNWEMSVQIGEKAKYPENWEKYTVINLVPTLRKDQIALIFDCGDSDFFLEVNKNYHE